MNRVFFLLCIFVLVVPSTVAARGLSLNFAGIGSIVNARQTIQIPVVLENPDQVPINSVSATVAIPKRAFLYEQYWLGESLVSLWVEQPTVTESDSAYYISFTGLIPGGTIKGGVIATFVVQARDPLQRASVSLLDPVLYKHTATADALRLPEKHVFLEIVAYDAGLAPQQEVVIADQIPPEEFFPIVGRREGVFDGAYFVMFKAVDRQSGIGRYELLEADELYAEDELDSFYWRSVSNPARLNDQELQSYVYVRATDNAGNARTVIIPPTGFVEKNSTPRILGVFIFLLSLAFGCIVLRLRRAHYQHDTSQGDV